MSKQRNDHEGMEEAHHSILQRDLLTLPFFNDMRANIDKSDAQCLVKCTHKLIFKKT